MKRPIVLLVVAFVATRIFLVATAGAPMNIVSSNADFDRYRSWSSAIVNDGVMPYSEVTVEYPPGSLPFVLAPELLGRTGLAGPDGEVGENRFRDWFVAFMVLVDVVGFAGAVLLARRTGAWLGAGVWVVGLFLLGPIVYLRLDLVPAVATLLAIERMAAGAAFSSGALLGFGIVAKLYPVLLLPAAIWRVMWPRRFALGVGVVIVVALLPFVTAVDDVWRSVIGYHADRGIQLESSWGGWLILAARRGYDVGRVYAFGAQQLVSGISPLLKTASTVFSATAFAGATAFVVRRVTRGNVAGIAAGLYGVLAVVMFFGSVLSPQFIMWLIALGAAALCFDQGSNRAPLLLVVVIAAATQFVFPFNYFGLVNGELAPLLFLIARNLLILGSGLSVLAGLSSSGRVPEPVPRPGSDRSPS